MFTLSLPFYGIEISVSESPVSFTESRFNHSYITKLRGVELFSGNDFSPSPMDSNNPLEMLVSCLSFHCLKPGDTDSEYFENYTSEQLAWANSFECEQLNCLLSDFEDKKSEFHQDAFETLSAGLTTI